MSQEDGGSGGESVGAAVVVVGRREGLRKGPWTAAEDSILVEYVRRHGEGNWNGVQKNSGLKRCGKSCRLRWANHLRPNLKKGAITADEERLIIDLHAKFGNKWARMAAQLPGRTDNEIKNYWNTRVKRRLRAGLPIYPRETQHQFQYNHYHRHQNQIQLQPVQQTLINSSPPSSLSSLLSSPPPPEQQPMLYGQTSSYNPKGTLFDALNIPVRNPSSLYLPNPAPNHSFKVFRDNTGGLSLSLCSSPPTLDHQGLITPNFPPKHSNQFDSLNFTTNQNSIIDFSTNQNSIVGAKPGLHSIQDSDEFYDNVGLGYVVALSSHTNDNYEVAPKHGNSGLLGDLLGESQVFDHDKSKGENSLMDEIGGEAKSGTEDFGSKMDSMSSDNSSAATKVLDGTEEENIMDDDLLSLLDFQQTAPVPDWDDKTDSISTEQTSHMVNYNIGTNNDQPSPPHLIDNSSTPTSREWGDANVCFWNIMPGIN